LGGKKRKKRSRKDQKNKHRNKNRGEIYLYNQYLVQNRNNTTDCEKKSISIQNLYESQEKKTTESLKRKLY